MLCCLVDQSVTRLVVKCSDELLISSTYQDSSCWVPDPSHFQGVCGEVLCPTARDDRGTSARHEASCQNPVH